MSPRLIVAAIVAVIVWALVAWAEAETRPYDTLGNWRTLPQDMQRSIVYGALEYTDALGMLCREPVTVNELMAALQFRPNLDLSKSWAWSFALLQRQHGCKFPTGEATQS